MQFASLIYAIICLKEIMAVIQPVLMPACDTAYECRYMCSLGSVWITTQVW